MISPERLSTLALQTGFPELALEKVLRLLVLLTDLNRSMPALQPAELRHLPPHLLRLLQHQPDAPGLLGADPASAISRSSPADLWLFRSATFAIFSPHRHALNALQRHYL
jgi:hypothetical protein